MTHSGLRHFYFSDLGALHGIVELLDQLLAGRIDSARRSCSRNETVSGEKRKARALSSIPLHTEGFAAPRYSVANAARLRHYDVRRLRANEGSARWPKCDPRNGSDKTASVTRGELDLKSMTIGDGLDDREAETVSFDARRGGSEEPIEDPRK